MTGSPLRDRTQEYMCVSGKCSRRKTDLEICFRATGTLFIGPSSQQRVLERWILKLSFPGANGANLVVRRDGKPSQTAAASTKGRVRREIYGMLFPIGDDRVWPINQHRFFCLVPPCTGPDHHRPVDQMPGAWLHISATPSPWVEAQKPPRSRGSEVAIPAQRMGHVWRWLRCLCPWAKSRSRWEAWVLALKQDKKKKHIGRDTMSMQTPLVALVALVVRVGEQSASRNSCALDWTAWLICPHGYGATSKKLRMRTGRGDVVLCSSVPFPFSRRSSVCDPVDAFWQTRPASSLAPRLVQFGQGPRKRPNGRTGMNEQIHPPPSLDSQPVPRVNRAVINWHHLTKPSSKPQKSRAS